MAVLDKNKNYIKGAPLGKNELTLDLLVSLIPKNHKRLVSQDTVDTINKCVIDPDYGKEFSRDILTHIDILGEPSKRWSMKDYIGAIKFYSLTAQAWSQVDAYCAVFPNRLQARLDRGEVKADMGGEASRYNASELVNRIREQSLVPIYLVNQGIAQQAINKLAYLMGNAKSEKVQSDSAVALLKELKPPEAQKIELDIGVSNTNAIADLRKATEELAMAQLSSIKAGSAVKQIAESSIINVEIEDE